MGTDTILFDDKAIKDSEIQKKVAQFLGEVNTLEAAKQAPIVIYQDGKGKGYYIKCGIQAKVACPLIDLNAKLDPADKESFRANRELLLKNNTYKRMVADAKEGREFNDIIAEYTKDYSPGKPLKIWGGQHRVKAIEESYDEAKISRHHGFKIFFNLSKQQRTEIALISNTNIAVSNDLFDRLQEETFVGLKLRPWCYQVGLLKEGEDFPDLGSRSEKITVKLARTFVTNFFIGKEKASNLKFDGLDKNIYEPHLCESGVDLDSGYERIIGEYGDSIWQNKPLLQAGKSFAALHKAQYNAVKERKEIANRKGFRNKAMTESVISAWAFISGLLQNTPERLQNHYSIPRTNKSIPDPLNAFNMSNFRHDSDERTYRGLGTRSALKDRQRMAQLFLARSLQRNGLIDTSLMNKAVSTVVGIRSLQKGYTA
jgi:hypothetical protein